LMHVQTAYNRHEIPRTTEDYVSVDHRQGRAFEPGDMTPYLRATWNVIPDLKGCIEIVHQLTDFGALTTVVMTGTSKEGFDAEWREVGLFAFEGDRIGRFEVFDEADLDAALARFDELRTREPQLENAASQAESRFGSYFAARNWDAIAELIADNFSKDDRRRMVNAGVTHGREAEIASQRAIAGVGVSGFTQTVIATRGERLALGAYFVSDNWGGSKVLTVSEINADNQIVARVAFDPDDLDAAFAELDARYLAGEAAAHARTWMAQMQVRIAYNQHKVFPATEDFVSVDHRRGNAFPPGEMIPYVDATWKIVPDLKGYFEAVHRLSDFSSLSTIVRTGTSQDGFDAEWREIGLVTFNGDQICRFEVYDEADLDAALARFDELERP
jgi:hypothetical protein